MPWYIVVSFMLAGAPGGTGATPVQGEVMVGPYTTVSECNQAKSNSKVFWIQSLGSVAYVSCEQR